MNLSSNLCLQPLVLALGAVIALGLPAVAAAGPARDASVGYEAFQPISGGADACAAACRSDKQCGSWSFIMPGVTGPTGECRLRTVDQEAQNASADEITPRLIAETNRPIGAGTTAATKRVARGSKAQEDRLQMPIEAETPEALGSIAAPLGSTAPTATWIQINK